MRLPGGLVVKVSPSSAVGMGLIPGQRAKTLYAFVATKTKYKAETILQQIQ